MNSLSEYRFDEGEKIKNDTRAKEILVKWNTPTDAENPQQWSRTRKWVAVSLVSAQGTVTPIASTLPTIATLTIAADFGITSALSPTLPIAFFVLGLGLGSLFLAPLSELFGRRLVYLVSFSIFALLNVGCALAPSMASLTVLRLLSGMAGSAGPSLGGASIGDLFKEEERGSAQALYGLGPTFGPVIGGLLGGFILEGTGSWRWLMWVAAIAPSITAILCVIFLRETYSPFLLRKKARALQKGDMKCVYKTEYDDVKITNLFLLSITRPLRLLFTSPICASMALYIGIVYSMWYFEMISLALLFSPTSSYGLYTYGWPTATSGLSFLGTGSGILLGSFIAIKFSDSAYAWTNARRQKKLNYLSALEQRTHGNRQAESLDAECLPEGRMLMLQIGMLVIPIGLTIFAWTAGRTHWIVPLIGASTFATGFIIVYVNFQTYIVDIFGQFAASALATATILRSVLGCTFTVFGFEMYQNLGYAWATMVLVFICLAMLPLPIILTVFGPRLRKKRLEF